MKPFGLDLRGFTRRTIHIRDQYYGLFKQEVALRNTTTIELLDKILGDRYKAKISN